MQEKSDGKVEGMTHPSLFSGIGGMGLAAEWAGFKTVAQCEWADDPTKILESIGRLFNSGQLNPDWAAIG